MNKNNIIKIIFYLFVLLLLVLNIPINSLVIDTVEYDDLRIQIGSPVETYCLDESLNLNRLTITSNYIVMNNTGFNITTPSNITLEIVHLAPSPFTASSSFDEIIIFKLKNTIGSTVYYNMSGFTGASSDVFWVRKNNNTIANDWIYGNYATFHDTNPTAGDEYVVRLNMYSIGNNPPTVLNPSPAMQSTENNLNVSLSVDIYDYDADTMTWSIWTNMSGGNGDEETWKGGRLASGTTFYRGTIWANTTTNFTEYNKRYWWSVNVTDGTNTTNTTYYFDTKPYVEPPDEINVTYNSATEVNFSWVEHYKDHGVDSYIVVQRNDTFASSVNQSGNWVRLNTTSAYGWETQVSTLGYITVFTWNESSDIYSYNDSNSQGTNANWGVINMFCYNETDCSQILEFDMLIVNDNLDTYRRWNCTNDETTIYYENITYGDDTFFYITGSNTSNDGKSKYESRTYHYDLEPNHVYSFDFFLPLSSPETDDEDYDPTNTSYSDLYRLTVENEYEEPIDDVKIQVMRYISCNTSFMNMTIMISDANGNADMYLYPDVVYKVRLSKTGYETRTDEYTPSLVLTKTFRLYFNDTEFDNATDCGDIISFTGKIDGTTMYLNYTDSSSSTINTTIYIYEFDHATGVESLYGTYSNTSESMIRLIISGVDSNNTYVVYLYVTHNLCGDMTYTNIVELSGLAPGIDTDKDEFNDMLDELFGGNPFLWNSIGGLFLVMLCLFAFGEGFRGVSIMMCGGLLLFVDVVVGIALVGVVIPVVIIVLGFLVQWNVSRRDGGG